MKNPLAILPLMIAALGNIFDGIEATGYSLRKSPWGKKRKIGHTEGLPKGACYNKTILRCQKRSEKPEWGKPT